MGGRRARVFTKCSQRAVEGGGERSRGLGNQEGHRVTAALGVGVVVVACLADPAGACDAAPRAISLRAPLWYSGVGDDEGFLFVCVTTVDDGKQAN